MVFEPCCEAVLCSAAMTLRAGCFILFLYFSVKLAIDGKLIVIFHLYLLIPNLIDFLNHSFSAHHNHFI